MKTKNNSDSIMSGSMGKRRRFTITEPGSYFLNLMMTSSEFNQKEQSIVIAKCLDECHQLFYDRREEFFNLTLVNVCNRVPWKDEIWCRFNSQVEAKFIEMNEAIINHVAGFNSPSSLVNHAIAFAVVSYPGALSGYVTSIGLQKPTPQ